MLRQFITIQCDEDGAPIGEVPQLINISQIMRIAPVEYFANVPMELKWNQTGIQMISENVIMVKPSYEEVKEILKKAGEAI